MTVDRLFRIPLALCFLLFLTSSSWGQNLRGNVLDASGGEPVQGATVTLIRSLRGAAGTSVASSPEGAFEFEGLRPGYYRIEVVAQGFESQTINEILIASGKEQVLELSLRRSNAQLPEITISSTIPGRRPLQPLSEIPLTRDQTLRFPATFFDPARLAMAYPGVAQVDDGTNTMSIRGNSPATLSWRLEGLDIVNPNHLPNAGTISDRPNAASGGVLLFSAQMIDNSSLMTGAFPAGYGDAVTGVMDMHLRAGNAAQHEFTAQAGLSGLDLAAEGPMKKGGKNSYLFNYRYSTVGLLGQLGVSFGDEQINFQDFACHFNLKGKKSGQYSVFAMAGVSENNFDHKEDSTEVKSYKDLHDIVFQSRTGVIGSSGRWKIGARQRLRAAVVYSVQTNDWSRTLFEYPTPYDYDNRTEERFSATLEWRTSIRNGHLTAGWQGGRRYFAGQIEQVISHEIPGVSVGRTFVPYYLGGVYYNHQLWGRWDWASPNGHWNTQAGLQLHYNDTYGQVAPAPRGVLSYRFNRKHRISLSTGLFQQDAPIWACVLFDKVLSELNGLPYVQSFQTGLRYVWTPARNWRFSTELFHQATGNIPALGPTATLNTPELISNQIRFETARMRNYGVELGLERSVESGWFLVTNATVFRSQYRLKEGNWLDSRWDIGHILNATLGREWLREKSDRLTRTLGVGLRGVWTGGPREADIDFGASEALSSTVYNETLGYYRRYADYFRIDLRVYWKRSLGGRRNSTFALDIQNITGQENLAYHYYDPLLKSVENKLQLGPIPNFSWRVEF